jgi:4-amino-4-deoxy-L-arabinose transferase-like glycosyltransferase
MAAGRLSLWVWVLPLASAIAAVLAWTVWCHSERGTWLGGVLILTTGVLVFALTHESLPHRRGFGDWLLRWGLALLAGVHATALVFLGAGLGYYLRCPPF